MEPLDIQRHLEIEKARLPRYRNFCERYGIEQFEEVVALYDIDELVGFMPPYPSEEDKLALQQLIGTRGEAGYMDYRKSNNTFELIMQWQEKTGNFGQNALFFTQSDGSEGKEGSD